MFADLATAQTLGDLDALYVNWVGYSIVTDHAEIGEAVEMGYLRDMLAGYIREFCCACNVPCVEVFGEADAS